MTEKENYATLAEKVKAIEAAIADATAFADLHALEFRFPAPAYGMGGYYAGKGHPSYNESGRYGNDTPGWSASSQSC